MDDSKIIVLMKENPAEGLKAAVDKYSPLVTAIVKRVLHSNTQDMEECVADTFVKFWETAKTLDPEDSSVRAYLICISRNLAINRYNYLKRRQSVSIDDALDTIPDGEDIEAEVLQGESIETLMEAVEALPEPNREILIRRYFLFEPVKQIAAGMGFSAAMVANRIQYAKLHLRKTLVTKGVSL